MLQMMGGETLETCWATHKRQVINLWNCCILLVELFEYIIVFFCTVHCNMIIQYKPTKYTLSNWILIIVNFLCLLHVSNSRVHLQEDGCVCSYGMVRFTCISISSLVGGRVSSAYKTAYTDAYKTYYTITAYTTVFLKMNPRVRNV